MAQETEAVAMDLNIVSCQTCDALFIESERRQTCPSCGGPPVGPYFRFVLDGAGLHQKDGAVAPRISREEAVQQLKDLGYPAEVAEAKVAEWEEPAPAAAEAPAAEAPAVEEEVVEEEAEEMREPSLPMWIGTFLADAGVETEELKDQFVGRGAEPEAAAIAVGRLAAVRDLLRELAAAGVEAQTEVERKEAGARLKRLEAETTQVVKGAVEETPAEAPEPEGEPTT